ncbi:hypothetical protein [Prauserella flavalba]|uniref:hypothetical protein n=1 Tax=Prauserella flavalba TaxID=1477506 RepID=UPI0036EC9D60
MAGKSQGHYEVTRVREHAQRHVTVDLVDYAPVKDPATGDAVEPVRLTIHYARTHERAWQPVAVTLGGTHRRVWREVEWSATPLSAAQQPLGRAPRWVRDIVAAESPADQV